MTLQIIRKDGKVRGFAFFFAEARVLAVGENEQELWRVCDCCPSSREAIVFCRTHARYMCGRCLSQNGREHFGCDFISASVARDLAQRAQRWAEVEALP